MAVSAQETPELSTAYPLPPPFFKAYTNDNLKRFAALKVGTLPAENEDKPPVMTKDKTANEPLFLDPPPPIVGTYRTFGNEYSTDDRVRSLKELGIHQLYPETELDRIAELKKLNHSLLLNFLELVHVLVNKPNEFENKLAHVRSILINIHHMLNEYRPHQARDTLRLMMERQISRRISTTNEINNTKMPYQTTGPILNYHASSASAVDILANAREFIRDKLYFTWLSQPPQQYPNVHFFTVDNVLVYINFYSDFGPSNIAHVMRFCEIVKEKFENPINAGKKLCLYSSMENDKRANAAFLICAYMVVVHKLSPEEAFKPLVGVNPPFLPYRDAGYGAATYHITVPDCLRGLYRGLQIGLFHIDTFDVTEYEFYEKVENGDFNWITDKFLALASPKEDAPPLPNGLGGVGLGGTAPYSMIGGQSQFQGFVTSAFGGRPQPGQQVARKGDGGRLFSAYRMDDLIRYLKEHRVCTIVRLNNKIYDRKKFLDAGIEHIDLYFPDGTTPPEGILKRFLEICETRAGPIAVHCKAGLGRTGSLIASYLMKHYKLTAAECISFLRVMRPGSVVGPQQNWLQSMQAKLWKMHPTTKLPASISLLRPSTFATSTRFAAHAFAITQPSQPEHQASGHPSPGALDVDGEEEYAGDSEEEHANHPHNQAHPQHHKRRHHRRRHNHHRSSRPASAAANKQHPDQMDVDRPSSTPGATFVIENYSIPVQPRKGTKGEIEDSSTYSNPKPRYSPTSSSSPMQYSYAAKTGAGTIVTNAGDGVSGMEYSAQYHPSAYANGPVSNLLNSMGLDGFSVAGNAAGKGYQQHGQQQKGGRQDRIRG
ncbi:Dual specificity protein phosphatase cdc14a [Quaeritorhiza haematococci]|nr:Dual specificity protein phosphatase cdc14a [Quaeritorhiza haematococci]